MHIFKWFFGFFGFEAAKANLTHRLKNKLQTLSWGLRNQKNNTRKCSELLSSKYMILHKILIGSTTQCKKCRQWIRKVRPSNVRMSKSNPKGTEKWAKRCQNSIQMEPEDPKGGQKEPKVSHMPKCMLYIMLFGRRRNDFHAKTVEKGKHFGSSFSEMSLNKSMPKSISESHEQSY